MFEMHGGCWKVGAMDFKDFRMCTILIQNGLTISVHPSKILIASLKKVVLNHHTFLLNHIQTFVVAEVAKQPIEKVAPRKVEATQGNSIFSQISNFSREKLKPVEIELPQKCKDVLKFVSDCEMDFSLFDNAEFITCTKDYLRILAEEKVKKTVPPPPPRESIGTGAGPTRSWKVINHLSDDDTTNIQNLRFYRGEITLNCEQNGEYIQDIHKKWFGKYDKMEIKHDYIQILFPIRESGLNGRAQSITKHESKVFRESPELQDKIISSYELILDFFGIMLLDRKSGKLGRDPVIWAARSHNLNTSSHNYLRITRIMKCLGIVGLEHLKLPFILFMIDEVLKYKSLGRAEDSLLKYWMPTLRKESELQIAEKKVFAIIGKKLNRSMYDWETENWSVERIMDVEPLKEDKTTPEYGNQNKSNIGGYMRGPGGMDNWRIKEEREEKERSELEKKRAKEEFIRDHLLE